MKKRKKTRAEKIRSELRKQANQKGTEEKTQTSASEAQEMKDSKFGKGIPDQKEGEAAAASDRQKESAPDIAEKISRYSEGEEAGTVRNHKKERFLLCGRIAGAVLVLLFLIWYFAHTDYYLEDGEKTLTTTYRTCGMLLISTGLIALCLIPNRLSDQVNRRLGWSWFVAAPFAVYLSLLHLNATKFRINLWELNKIALGFTFLFLFLVITFFVLICGSIRISAMILAVLIAALGIANWYVVVFRGQALSAADIFSVGAAMTVAAGYDFEIGWYVFSEIFCTLAICIISCKIRGFRALKLVPRMAVLGVWLVLTGSYYHICCRTSFLEDHDIRSGGFTHQLRYKQFDMLFTTLCTCFYMAAEKPEGYSVERVQEIGEAYVKQSVAEQGEEQDGGREGSQGDSASADQTGEQSTGQDEVIPVSEKTPHLIVIMNESFADYTDIGVGLDLSEDCMPFIHGLTENTIKGYAYTSIFGANTPNSEYEFLTGNTMGFLPPTSVGFNLFVRGEMPSLASQLKSEGYDTLAIHPYRGTNYRRNIVYPQIGFDTYLTRDDFNNAEYIRRYISDAELARKIILKYKEQTLRSDNPLFCYNVTIQNHGDYLRSNSYGVPDDIEVKNGTVNRTKTTMYVNLIKKSDEMFEKLVKFFSEEDEPVAILMFGDHQANLGDNTYEYLLGKSEDDLTPEELMEKFKVPFVFWTNFDIEEEVIDRTSLNYLYSILADRLGLPMTGYQHYLLELSEEIPVLAAGGYWTADGDFYELDDEESPYYEKINEYHILEYNYIFGKKDRYLDLFELP